MEIDVFIASQEHLKYAQTICDAIEKAAYERGTGIAKRAAEYVEKKIKDGKAVIALTRDGQFAGFSYIETWEHEKYVATSGLIVVPEFLSTSVTSAAGSLPTRSIPPSSALSAATPLTTGTSCNETADDLDFPGRRAGRDRPFGPV